ncbi:MAG: hypothetical protein NZ516_07885 [Raineya sp.]|nr:hypothetical protein [Raineya sp.]
MVLLLKLCFSVEIIAIIHSNSLGLVIACLQNHSSLSFLQKNLCLLKKSLAKNVNCKQN